MKLTKCNRLLSFLLALLMVFFCFPVTALGNDEENLSTERSETVSQSDTADTLTSETKGLGELTELPDIVLDGMAEDVGELVRLPLLEKDLYTIAYTDTSGQCSMKMFGYPVKFVDDDGKIKDISLEIKPSSNGGFITAANNIITKFSQKFTDGISLEYDDIKVELIPVKNTDGKLTTEEMGAENATLSENKKKVSYAFGSKTRLDYELTYTGFKEDIVVESYTGQTEYNFLIKTNGLALVNRNGSYFIEDSESNVKATIGDIIIFTADERNNTFGSMTHTVVKENQIYAMTIHVDADFLKDAKTTYPIRIDPTIEINYDNNGAGAIYDTTINNMDTLSTTNGSIAVGKYAEDNSVSRILMRFPSVDFTQYTPNQLISVSVSIRDLQPGTTGTTVSCYRFNGNTWTEPGNISWSTVNADAYADLQSSHTVSYASGSAQSDAYWYSFDITNLAKQWADETYDQAKGILFKASDETEAGTAHVYKIFGSYNRASYKPELTVEYVVYPDGYISFDNTELELEIGDSDNVLAVIENANGSPSYESSDDDIATVDSSGTVTAHAPGTAIITGTIIDYNGNEWHSYCTVYVEYQDGSIYFPTSCIEIPEGGTASLNTIVTPSHLTVTYTSLNSSVATVDSSGTVTGIKAGVTSIEASVIDENGNRHLAYCTVYTYIPDGIYKFKSSASDFYIEVPQGTIWEDTVLVQWVTENNRNSRFKLHYLGYGQYSIRSMLKSDMGLETLNNKLVNGSIGTSDTTDALALTSIWRFTNKNNGYCIENLYNSKVITSPSAIYYGSDYTLSVSEYQQSNLQLWELEKLNYSASAVEIREKTSKLIIGDQYQFEATMYSSMIGVNGQHGITWSIIQGSAFATIDTLTGELTGVSTGTVTVKATYGAYNWYSTCTVEIIPMKEGMYSFQNRETLKYMQPDNNGNTHIEQHAFNSSANQRWRLLHHSESYYYIINAATGKYLTAPDNFTDESSILMCEYNSSIQDRQLWIISRVHGKTSYKIQSKKHSVSNMVIAVGWGANWNGVNVEQRPFALDDNYKDEWLLINECDIRCIGIPDETHTQCDHTVTFPSAKNNLNNRGFQSFEMYEYITVDTLCSMMTMSKIVVTNSHGTQTKIILNDSDFTVSIVNDLPNGAFNELKLVVFVACLTGKGREDANNLVNAMANKGAQVVIGFEKSIYCSESDIWVNAFFDALGDGYTIDSAISFAHMEVARSWTLDISTDACYAVGNTNQTISNN